ncbi:SDR family NAD(P)-dependent oxidoreductase [Bacillus sp. EB106-08-02-XG196]|uniref:SDR family NAD(P)-dependent oxidoreductase n=1 Tax=Bacillus sp. EB106-08-02-XG196 TaxID=2737049 RepID=UPI0015C48295|nr:SDR family NAD(P)-dependent oxidoreductase [Bacillus sp. EB106-08-02-XG196]NWQ43485.1 SDR family NAD(P)-dependent oxidoreductase [Bacillus sp. EB106-08-02-XG196]
MSLKQLFDLTGQTAIVTGGGSGLGRVMALALAEAGANVVVCSRRLEVCEEVVKEIEALGKQALALAVDVTNPESVVQGLEKAVSHFGKIEILVNSSGTVFETPATEMPLKQWQSMLDTNVTGTFLMCQAVGKQMIENAYGKIINISSSIGFKGVDPEAVDSVGYTTSKGAVMTLTKDLAVKWGRHGVYVNSIAPGVFTTGMNNPEIPGTLVHKAGPFIASQVPVRRLGNDNDLVGALLYFASAASNYCTGQILVLDGGLGAK